MLNGVRMEAQIQSAVDEFVSWEPQTEEERDLVRHQMERLLETHHFRNSRRYPAVFRFIVEEALQGRGEFLKERLLGVQVFGRPSDYDTAADPVVRVTVAEIRKRIAQYYHDQGHDTELRIELLPGSYEPEFRCLQSARTATTEVPTLPPASPEHPPASITPAIAAGAHPLLHEAPTIRTPSNPRLAWWVAGLCVASVLITAVVSWLPSLRPSAVDVFWQPIMEKHQPVMMIVPVAGGKYGVAAKNQVLLPGQSAGQSPLSSSASTPARPDSYLVQESLGEDTVFSDVRALQSASDVLAEHKIPQHMRLNTAVTLDDLRQSPAVLIGGMSNQWTLHAIRQLRYQFGGSDQGSYYIVDTRTNKPMPWALDVKTPTTVVTRDYAIIARIHAEGTGQPEVIIAGIGMSGTSAAGEFLANPAEMQQLRDIVGKGFKDRDFEAVISTDVVNGISGFAKILAVEVY